MTAQEYFAEDLKQRETKKQKKDFIKGEKLLSVNTRIASHDLQAKIKLATKWLQKNYEVRVIISRDGGDPNKMEQIAKDIEKIAGNDGRVLQKRSSNSDIRFSVIPLKKKDESEPDDSPPGDSTPSKDTHKQQVRSYSTSST